MKRLLFVALLLLVRPLAAGIYYSEETYADLPSHWRGFLLDQRALRLVAVPAGANVDASPLRLKYLDEAKRLADKGKPSADEQADLGALYLRLGEVGKAIEVLRPAQRAHPNHFAINANMGAAWHLSGDWPQAFDSLQRAVELAPGKWQHVEELHLKLVRLRMKQSKLTRPLDDLFAVQYALGEAGKLADAERKKLPARAVALTQQLALWFPNDGQLLWQLAELANAHGDLRNAASMMDGCVTQFAMLDPLLRQHRQIIKEALARQGDAAHDKEHQGTLAFRSRRPLLSRFIALPLPPISAAGVNHVPWEAFNETTVEAGFKPKFSSYVLELEKKQVSLAGFMFPLGENLELETFLFLESPVGCWYCEMPETTSILHVRLAKGSTTTYQRGYLKVAGTLTLNRTDSEDFLYSLQNARIVGLD